ASSRRTNGYGAAVAWRVGTLGREASGRSKWCWNCASPSAAAARPASNEAEKRCGLPDFGFLSRHWQAQPPAGARSRPAIYYDHLLAP
ncbi:MAG: hypothetical protein OEW36_11395, partial [Hylemonella sp.]|nr:hypothetical protein [Hylemonella sp.]